MLPVLTKYLLRFKRISIPNVGSFEIIQQSPEYKVEDHIIKAPRFRIKHDEMETVTDHQLRFLATVTGSDEETMRNQLKSVGDRIRGMAAKEGFNWNGIGAIRMAAGKLNFEDHLISMEGWDAVPANRVIRENVEHTRLVGDRQTSSAIHVRKAGKRPLVLSMKWGWIILAIASLLILFLLFKNQFSPLGSGLQWKTTEGGY